jgi:hypothetical protein
MDENEKEALLKALQDAGVGNLLLRSLVERTSPPLMRMEGGCGEDCPQGCSKCCSSGSANR